jgi:hypothetical protein
MAAPIPTTEPAVIVAGDTAKWTKSLADYSAADGWALSYTLVNSASRYTFSATASGSDFAVTVAAATTTAYAAGLYDWRAQVSKAAEVFTVGAGQFTVQPSFASATDGRSSARKSLDQVVAYMANSANLEAAEYEIAGRRLKRLSIPELIQLKSHLSAEVQRETAASRAAAGLPDQRRVYTRFLSPY